MENSNFKSNQELTALNNVINKLQIYMLKNGQSLHGLAATMGFSYQPFYRLITKKHMPTISSLGLIAFHLNCSIAELTHQNVFVDINYYENFNIENQGGAHCRIYIPYEQYIPLVHNIFFAVKNLECNNVYYLFNKIEKITIDGIFLVEYKSKISLINILSISSKFVVIEEDKCEVKVDITQIKPIAKLFNLIELISSDEINKLFGIIL